MTPASKSVGERHALSQKTLVEFLQADLDLCVTILTAAEATSDPEHYRSALRRAGEGLVMIRRLSGRIEDPQAWKVIHERADELEKALASFPAHHRTENSSTNI